MAACYETLTFDECNAQLAFAAGMRVSRVWQSVYPCVFLELGRLSRAQIMGRRRIWGQATIMIQSDWRIDGPRSILLGSSFAKTALKKGLRELVRSRVAGLAVEEDSRELRVRLSRRRTLRTFTEWTDQPMWTVLVRDRSLLELDRVWDGVDVDPCFHLRDGRPEPEIEYCFDEKGADIAALRRRYRFE